MEGRDRTPLPSLEVAGRGLEDRAGVASHIEPPLSVLPSAVFD